MRVKIESDGTGWGTKVSSADGSPISGVVGLTFRASIDDISRVELDLGLVRIDAIAAASFYVRNKEVRRIEYADGTFDGNGLT